jgi:hypothetical protein
MGGLLKRAEGPTTYQPMAKPWVFGSVTVFKG